MPKKDPQVPGNVLATQANLQREASRLTIALHKVDYVHDEDDGREPWLVGIRLKPPDEGQPDWLCVLTGDTREGPVVAFHTAGTLVEVLRGAGERFVNKSLKWRKDEYRNERSAATDKGS